MYAIQKQYGCILGSFKFNVCTELIFLVSLRCQLEWASLAF